MQTTPQATIDRYTESGWWGHSTVTSLFDLAVAARPNALCLLDQFNRSDWTDGSPLSLNWEQAGQAVEDLSVQFFNQGIRADDFVVIQLPNIGELPLCYLALAKLGAIVSPVPVQYAHFELKHVIETLKSPERKIKAFISTSRLKDQRLCESNSQPFIDADIKVLSFGEDIPAQADPISVRPIQACEDYVSYIASRKADANDIFSICWTSGTTGQPKGVPRSHNHWMVSGTASLTAASMQTDDRILNPFPMVNMAGLGGFFFPWLIKQNQMVLHHPFDIAIYLRQIEQEKISYSIAAPAILNMLLKQPELMAKFDLRHLRAIGAGSAPLSDWMVSEFQHKFNIEVINLFGSNEGICLASNSQDLPSPADRAKYFPRFGVEGLNWRSPISASVKTRLRSLLSGEITTEAGIEGELEINGASVFDGYWQSPADNAQVFTDDGYFKTGDVFKIPEDPEKSAFYEFSGRCKDIIMRGGVNISPDELDTLLAGHPKLSAVVVVGYFDEIMGEKVGAAVVCKPGCDITLTDISDYLTERGVAKFKFPERLRVIDEIPMNAIGKVLRRKLQPLFTSD